MASDVARQTLHALDVARRRSPCASKPQQGSRPTARATAVTCCAPWYILQIIYALKMARRTCMLLTSAPPLTGRVVKGSDSSVRSNADAARLAGALTSCSLPMTYHGEEQHAQLVNKIPLHPCPGCDRATAPGPPRQEHARGLQLLRHAGFTRVKHLQSAHSRPENGMAVASVLGCAFCECDATSSIWCDTSRVPSLQSLWRDSGSCERGGQAQAQAPSCASQPKHVLHAAFTGGPSGVEVGESACSGGLITGRALGPEDPGSRACRLAFVMLWRQHFCWVHACSISFRLWGQHDWLWRQTLRQLNTALTTSSKRQMVERGRHFRRRFWQPASAGLLADRRT